MMRKQHGHSIGSLSIGRFALAALIILGGCTTTVEVDLPDHPPKIVANSFFRPGAVWEVHLSEARNLIEGRSAIRDIETGVVEILENEQVVVRLPYVGDGLYRSPNQGPRAGQSYTLRVSAHGYESVEATDVVPPSVPVTFVPNFVHRDSRSGKLDVKIRIQDPLDQDNYYRLFVFYRVVNERNEVSFYDVNFRTEDPAIKAENSTIFEFENKTLRNVLFSDAFFEEQAHEVEISIEEPLLRQGQDGAIQVMLFGVSKTYYDYASTYQLHTDVRDNPFAQPVQVHTNVEHGFGIFAGFNQYMLEVEL